MKGVNYITDAKGSKKAVVIDYKTYQEAIEDFLSGCAATPRGAFN